MGFEVWKGGRVNNKTEMAYINKDGFIQINSKAQATYFPNEIKYVRFYFDSRTRQIGIERLTHRAENAREVPKSMLLSLRCFFRWFKIEPKDIVGKYPIEHEKDHALITIKLGKG